MHSWRWLAIAAFVVGCGPVVDVQGSGGSTSTSGASSGSTATSSVVTSTTGAGPTTMASTTAAGTTGASTTDSPATTTAADGDSSTGWDCTMLPPCGGKILACGDGVDNDDDGRVDLDDPECTSTCDNDEDAFAFSIPGQFDCDRDCYFDGNSGHGDDSCAWSLKCDPLDPGTYPCGYYGNDCDPTTPPECVAFCEPFVPNGCDCFGCCTFETADGPKNLFLEHDDCTLADGLAGCPECTQHIEACGNACEPDNCEICIGQLAPPPECDEVGCVDGIPCTEHCDCPMEWVCITGCCIPPAEG